MTRHEIRTAEFLLLFEKMFREESVSDLVTLHETDYEFKCDEEVEKTVDEILGKLDELDKIIEKYSPSRSLSRIPKVNLSILRLAVFEIIYRSDKVPMNAKEFGQDSDMKFVNGVLGTFTRSLKKDG